MCHSDKSERSATTKQVSKLNFKIPKAVIPVPTSRKKKQEIYDEDTKMEKK
jgi:hypothetical protein